MPLSSPKPDPRNTEERPSRERVMPDSVSDAPDLLPDDMRRQDQQDEPDSLPEQEELALSPDGGAPDHPIHDEPLEDMQPEDYEAAIDDAERGQLERHIDEETIDPRATRDFAPGSSDPLDQQNRRPLRIPHP